MDKVKSIRQLKNNYYTVTTVNGRSVRVSEDTLVRHRLLKGEEISDDALSLIEKEAELDIGYQMALSYLSYQLRSEQEIKAYLKKKEISSEGILYVVQKLRELRLLDDLVFSESYVRTVMKTQDKGPQMIKQALMKKGVSKETIDKALCLFTFDEQEQIAKRVAEKALKKYHTKSYKEQQRKVQQLLYTKGFHSDVIQLVMANLDVDKDEENEWELLVLQGEKLWEKNNRLEKAKKKQKIKQALFQKGFDFEAINRFIEEKEMEDDNT